MSSFKNFLITFLASALIFGVVSYFTAHYISGVVTGIIEGDVDKNEKTSDGENNEPGKNAGSDSLKVPEGESYTFLIVCTDYKPDQFKDYTPQKEEVEKIVSKIDSDKAKDSFGFLESHSRRAHATAIVLVRVDKKNREYAVCYISPETRIFTPSGAATLYDTYGLYGINAFKEYITSLTGLKIDYHFLLDGQSIPDFTDAFGETSCNVDSDIYATSKYHVTEAGIKESDLDVETSAPETGTETEKDNKPALVLPSGSHKLDDYTINILNTLKERSADDIKIKESYITDVVEKYLRKIADLSSDELERKISQLTSSSTYESDNPLDKKPSLATNFTAGDVKKVYELIDAIDYFDFVKITYPGNYVETGDDSVGYYAPTLKDAIKDFLKYR